METNRDGLVQEKILFDEYRRKELAALYTEEEQLKAMQNRATVNEPIAEPNEGTEQQIEDILAYQDQEKIKINVGGRIFETQKSVLLNRESLFKVMLGSTFSIDKDDQGAFKMEEGHDPQLFSIILEHIKTGSTKDIGIDYSNMASLEKILSISRYYGTQELTDAIFSRIQHGFKTTIPEEENSTSESTTLHAEKHGSGTSTQFWKDVETHKQTFDDYIQKRKAEIEEQRTKIQSQKNTNETLKLNVSGRHFTLSVADIAMYPSSILFQLYERLAEEKKTNDTIFIDRDGDTFEAIETFLRTGTISHIPNIRSIKKRVQKEAKYYGITALEEFFSPMRYPLETIGKENIEMKQQEDLLRSLFAQDRDNAVLDDPYINMLPVFDLLDTFHPQDTQENIPQLFNFVLPVTEGMFCYDSSCNHMKTRKYYLKQQGTQIVQSLDEFKEQWDAFTTYLFDDIDWTGMFAAGGSVLASAQKVNDLESVRSFFYSLRGRYTNNWRRRDTNEEYVEGIEELMVEKDKEGEYSDLSDEEASKNVEELAKKKHWFRSVSGYAGLEAMNKESLLIAHYERSQYNGSDIDLFLYAMTEQEAENKIRYLYDTFKTNLQRNRPYTTIRFHDLKVRNCYKDQDILLVRTKDTVTFHFRYPIRPIQVILRLYKSPAEILMGFDVDCCCIGYDGNQLYTLPRGRRAINTRMNLVDVDRQSTTYEIRLAKYAKRGFSVGVPGLDFTRVTHHTRRKFWEMEQRQRENKEPEPERQGLAKLIDFDKNARTKGMHRMFYKCKNFDISNAAEREIYKQEVPTTELPAVTPAPATGRGRLRYGRRAIVATRQSDYEYFFVPFTPVITPKKIYSRIQFGINLIRTVIKVEDYAPSILATMDDVETILDNTNNTLSTITGRIQWLTINPGTQMVGSFNPVSKNFYEDAYVGGPKYQKKKEKQKKALQEWQETRKFAKYTWYYKNKGDQEFTAFPRKKSNALERLYREKQMYKFKHNWRAVNWRLDLGQYAETKREKESIQKDAEMAD